MRARAGEPEAFDALMRRYERRIAALSHRMLGRPDDVPDAVQQTFLRLYRYRERLDVAGPLWPYLCRIAVNVCNDLGRKRSRRQAIEGVPLDDLGEAAQPLEGRLPENDAMVAERQAMVRRCMSRLSERERQALVLRDVEGLTTEQVAAALGLEAVTVRSHISRARRRLRRLMAELEGDGTKGNRHEP